MNEILLRTWIMLKEHCVEEGIHIIPEPRPFDPEQKQLIKTRLRTIFYNLPEDLNQAAAWMEDALSHPQDPDVPSPGPAALPKTFDLEGVTGREDAIGRIRARADHSG